jgi:hypothetical protein
MATIIGTRDYELGELTEYHRNPRRGDTDAIARTLDALGQYKPIVVNLGTQTGREHEILAGNHTYRAAQKLGWKTIRAVTVDVGPADAERIMLADNRTSDLATYDHDTLLGILADLPDLIGTGFTAAELEALTPDPGKLIEQANKSQEGVNLFHQKKDWEERETRGILLDYGLDDYWKIRDMFDKAATKAGTKTPAETLLFLIEETTGERAPR